MTTMGIIGGGHVGSNLAEAAITHGYDVMLSNSQGPQTLAGRQRRSALGRKQRGDRNLGFGGNGQHGGQRGDRG